MTLQELESELKVKWDELVAHIHALFHKAESAQAPVEAHPAPASTPVEVAAPQTGNSNWLTADIAGQAVPQAPTPPVASVEPDCSGVLGPQCGQHNNIVVGSREIGAQGRVVVMVNDTPEMGGTQYPCVVTVGDQSQTINTDGQRTFEPVDTPVTVTASSAVVMQFRPA